MRPILRRLAPAVVRRSLPSSPPLPSPLLSSPLPGDHPGSSVVVTVSSLPEASARPPAAAFQKVSRFRAYVNL
ncbi:hypothetical protein ABZP36_033694 [Zizania latifolia]